MCIRDRYILLLDGLVNFHANITLYLTINTPSPSHNDDLADLTVDLWRQAIAIITDYSGRRDSNAMCHTDLQQDVSRTSFLQQIEHVLFDARNLQSRH